MKSSSKNARAYGPVCWNHNLLPHAALEAATGTTRRHNSVRWPLGQMAVKLAVARKAVITVFTTRRARLQMRCLRPAILRTQSSAPSPQSEETKMAHNHPPPWMNSNTRLGAYLPLPTTKTSPSSTGSKVGCRVAIFFARMRQVEQDRARREVRNVAHCCRVLKLLRHPTTTSNTQKSCEPEPPFSRLAAREFCDRPRPYCRGRVTRSDNHQRRR